LNCSLPAANADKDPIQRDRKGVGNEKIFPGFYGSIEVDYYVNRIPYHQVEKTQNRYAIEKKDWLWQVLFGIYP